jgi:peptidoglycan/xylan/chitin deacetylase (PgdA/CDA1 family)
MTAAVPILCYHGVGSAETRYERTFAVDADLLAEHLDLIEARGLQTMTITELARRRRRDEPVDGAVAVTFDDGYADLLHTVTPLLTERSMVATAFVTTGQLSDASRSRNGPRHWLTWRELTRLAAGPVEIGAHGHDHVPLDIVSLTTAERDLRHCKQTLEEHLGSPIKSLAYPFGHSTPEVREYVREQGFDVACGVRHALSGPNDDLYDLARLLVRSRTSTESLAQWLDGHGVRTSPCNERLRTRAARPVRRLRARLSRGG